MLNLDESPPVGKIALWHLGFRAFFFGAGLWSLIAMGLWMASYSLGVTLTPAGLPALLWHGHEMVFGYALAVAAGFLLTAVRNWTNVQTAHGPALMGLFSVWAAARLAPLVPGVPLLVFALLDCLFGVLLLVAIGHPLVVAKQWKQLGLLVIVGLLVLANILFFLGVTGVLPGIGLDALLAGLYLIVMLVALMAGRVAPMFIRNGVGGGANVVSYPWIERLALPSLALALFGQLLVPGAAWVAWAAALAAAIHGIRLYGWAVRGMWRHPLVWVLVAAYAWLVAGLVLMALGGLIGGTGTTALHALVVGALGMITVGMMSRVTLGHTGRMVNSEHRGLAPIYVILLLAAVVRVLLPIIDGSHYTLWILVSQGLWMLAFALFLWRFGTMWIRPRVDGRYG
jgi:uncharacterized protein involved in response to NO